MARGVISRASRVISTKDFGFPLGLPDSPGCQRRRFFKLVSGTGCGCGVPLGRLGLLPPRRFGSSSSARVFHLSSFAPLPYYRWPASEKEGCKMSLHDGDFGNARGRREAFENRDAIERRARIEAETASSARNRLEKGSPSSARRNFAGMLNELVRDAAGRELPGLAALAEIRKGQKYGYKTAADHNRAHFEKSEAFNRLHPESGGTNVPRDPTWSEPGYQSYIPGTSVTPGAGDRDARRERYVPPATAGRIRDAAGRLIGDGRAERTGETDINDGSDHWADGRVSAIRAAFLLDAARALIEAVRARAARLPEGRRDR